MKKGVTIVDIAKKLNMSTSTVSKALNDHRSISRLTKDRVKALANLWNYVPNEAARHFKLNKSFTLALIIPDLFDQFYVFAINGVEEVANKNKYNVIVSQTHEDPEKEAMVIDNLFSSRVDGVIIAISKNTKSNEKLKQLTEVGIPVIFLSRSTEDPSYSYVSSNNKSGTQKAIRLLIEKGHTRIAYIMGPRTLTTSHLRLDAYKNALIKYKISYDNALVKETDFTTNTTEMALKQLIELKNPPTAFFTFKTYISLDILDFFKLNYPQQLSIIDTIGFGNLPLIKYLENKPVGAIDENSFEMGKQAAEAIFSSMHANESNTHIMPFHIQIPCRLIVY